MHVAHPIWLGLKAGLSLVCVVINMIKGIYSYVIITLIRALFSIFFNDKCKYTFFNVSPRVGLSNLNLCVGASPLCRVSMLVLHGPDAFCILIT